MSNEINDLLMTPKEVLIVDILDKAISLDDDILDKLIEPKKGLYLPNHLKPILNTEDNNYYFENGNRIIDTEQLLSLEQDVYNKDKEVIMRSSYLKRKKNYILTKPNIPVIAIELMVTFIKNHITTLTDIPDNRISYHILTLIKPDVDANELLDNVYVSIDDLFIEISNFINKDKTFIYLYETLGTSLMIHKTCDYRIIEYYRLKEELSELVNTEED